VIRVLIADDQALVREAFRTMLELEDDMEVVGEAADGTEVQQTVAEHHPDLVLMDVRMPHLDGIEATERLASSTDPPRVLMLTTFDRDEYVYKAMRAGASGFLLKDVRRAQLLRAIRAVASGDSLVDPTITMRLIERWCHSDQLKPATTAFNELTPRELEVVKLVAQGFSNAEVSEHLYLSEATVKTHVARILSKLSLRDRVQVVVLAYESGLIRPGETRASDGG
jgi:DNA-binding NarL/FixJ family response regulator